MTAAQSLDVLLQQASSARTRCRDSRASAALARHRVLATRPGSARVVLPITARNGRLCALDGDGTPLCDGGVEAEKLIGYDWSDVPLQQRCFGCAAVLLGIPTPPLRHADRLGSAFADPDRGRRAFDHAVAAERRAIQVHENAAVMHRDVATRLDAAAAAAPHVSGAAKLSRRAHAERELALDASHRADIARRRLRDEGVDPTSG